MTHQFLLNKSDPAPADPGLIQHLQMMLEGEDALDDRLAAAEELVEIAGRLLAHAEQQTARLAYEYSVRDQSNDQED